MGCGQSSWRDDEIRQHTKEIEDVFSQRQNAYSQEDLERAYALLYKSIKDQQLNRSTWKLLDDLRKVITKGTPDNLATYVSIGYWYQEE